MKQYQTEEDLQNLLYKKIVDEMVFNEIDIAQIKPLVSQPVNATVTLVGANREIKYIDYQNELGSYVYLHGLVEDQDSEDLIGGEKALLKKNLNNLEEAIFGWIGQGKEFKRYIFEDKVTNVGNKEVSELDKFFENEAAPLPKPLDYTPVPQNYLGLLFSTKPEPESLIQKIFENKEFDFINFIAMLEMEGKFSAKYFPKFKELETKFFNNLEALDNVQLEQLLYLYGDRVVSSDVIERENFKKLFQEIEDRTSNGKNIDLVVAYANKDSMLFEAYELLCRVMEMKKNISISDRPEHVKWLAGLFTQTMHHIRPKTEADKKTQYWDLVRRIVTKKDSNFIVNEQMLLNIRYILQGIGLNLGFIKYCAVYLNAKSRFCFESHEIENSVAIIRGVIECINANLLYKESLNVGSGQNKEQIKSFKYYLEYFQNKLNLYSGLYNAQQKIESKYSVVYFLELRPKFPIEQLKEDLRSGKIVPSNEDLQRLQTSTYVPSIGDVVLRAVAGVFLAVMGAAFVALVPFMMESMPIILALAMGAIYLVMVVLGCVGIKFCIDDTKKIIQNKDLIAEVEELIKNPVKQVDEVKDIGLHRVALQGLVVSQIIENPKKNTSIFKESQKREMVSNPQLLSVDPQVATEISK